MSAFDKLKQAEQTIVTKETGWVKANRAWLIALVVAAVIGAILVKACTG